MTPRQTTTHTKAQTTENIHQPQQQHRSITGAAVAQRYSSGTALEDNRGLSMPLQRQPNHTGLPDDLKSGMENLSGVNLDAVKVHRNSDKPAAVQAHAYAQGNDIHLGPGQEKHLPHELGHVVQQAQGKVKSTMQMQGLAVNDDAGLEAQADKMGAQALQRAKKPSSSVRRMANDGHQVAQLVTYKGEEYTSKKGNLAKFHAVAGADLDKLNDKRNAKRDKSLLNAVGNSDQNFDSAKALASVIYPHGKEYQAHLKEEFKVLSPIVTDIVDLSKQAQAKAPLLATDETFQAHKYVTSNMNKVMADSAKILKVVQWKKVNTIDTLASGVVGAVNKNKQILAPEDEKSSAKKSAKTIKYEQKNLQKGVDTTTKDSEKIIDIAQSIEPELAHSADEQYVRGSLAVKNQHDGARHLNIGKKTETKPLVDQQTEEGKGVLWAGVWSHGVNKAFIEGGTDQSHEFKLISALPPELAAPLYKGDIKGFMVIAKKGAEKEYHDDKGFKDGPWSGYYHVDNKDLTTLGKEIVQLLRNGYVLAK